MAKGNEIRIDVKILKTQAERDYKAFVQSINVSMKSSAGAIEKTFKVVERGLKAVFKVIGAGVKNVGEATGGSFKDLENNYKKLNDVVKKEVNKSVKHFADSEKEKTRIYNQEASRRKQAPVNKTTQTSSIMPQAPPVGGSGSSAGFLGMASKLAGTFTAVTSAITMAVGKAIELGKALYDAGLKGANFKLQKQAFNELTGGAEKTAAAMELLKKAGSGNLNDQELMSFASGMMSLGANTEQSAQLLDIAQKNMVNFGGDINASTQALQNFITSGTGSTAELKKLGINITEVEARMKELAKQQGINIENLNQEERSRLTLIAITDTQGASTSEILKKQKTEADVIASVSTEFENLKLGIMEFIGSALQPIIRAGERVVSAWKDMIGRLLGSEDAVGSLQDKIIAFIEDAINYLVDAYLKLLPLYEEFYQSIIKIIKDNPELIQTLKGVAKAIFDIGMFLTKINITVFTFLTDAIGGTIKVARELFDYIKKIVEYTSPVGAASKLFDVLKVGGQGSGLSSKVDLGKEAGLTDEAKPLDDRLAALQEVIKYYEYRNELGSESLAQLQEELQILIDTGSGITSLNKLYQAQADVQGKLIDGIISGIDKELRLKELLNELSDEDLANAQLKLQKSLEYANTLDDEIKIRERFSEIDLKIKQPKLDIAKANEEAEQLIKDLEVKLAGGLLEEFNLSNERQEAEIEQKNISSENKQKLKGLSKKSLEEETIGKAWEQIFSGLTGFSSFLLDTFDKVGIKADSTVSVLVKGFGDVVGYVQNIKSTFETVKAIMDAIRTINTITSLIPFFRKGTDSAPGGLAVVGEEGPELVNLPRGSQVFPNGKTNAMLSNLFNSAPQFMNRNVMNVLNSKNPVNNNVSNTIYLKFDGKNMWSEGKNKHYSKIKAKVLG